MSIELPNLRIGGRRIGAGYPVYVIAEMSANHNQDLAEAIRLIEAAKRSGADAVKLQTYTPATLTVDSNKEYFRISSGTVWDGKTLFELYKEAYLPWDWYPRLKEVANQLSIDLFSTAFDATAIQFLESMDVPLHKVASFENIDIPLIRRMARTGKPLMISTGMATLPEIDEAVTAARQSGAASIALLKCTSAYPARLDEMNLRTIPHLAETFGVPVGLSDHTMGLTAPVAAVALGACIVEKHFTLSRSVTGPDSTFSLEPHEFSEMVDAVRAAERVLGRITYGTNEDEARSKVFRRSLFAVAEIRAGEPFTEGNVRSIRPGYGLHPRYLDQILGLKAPCDIEFATPLSWNLVKPGDASALELRPATKGDVRQVWEWRNEPGARSATITNSDPIPYETHERWYTAKLVNSSTRIFIVVGANGENLGSVRFEIEGAAAEISVFLAKNARGRGYGAATISQASELILGGTVERIVARIKHDNKASLNAFHRAGFVTTDACDEYLELSRTLQSLS